jgi:type II secretory ATPase GspE/PulE/Tfp pilus assembly ATPase PilB-like protein
MPSGCRHCGSAGYTGRTGLFELMVMNGGLRGLVMQTATTDELRKIATGSGMVSLKEEGLAKARLGITSLHEVSRVAQDWDSPVTV